MLSQVHYRDFFKAEVLDEYLADGWFRSCQCMYRQQILYLTDGLYSPVRIRLELPNYEFRKSLRKINKKVKENFRVEIKKGGHPGEAEKEFLYTHFKERLTGYLSPTLKKYLWGERDSNVFETYEVLIYDEEELVAVSFFDLGQDSIASILGIYHQDYESYSLGFYTMLAEIEFGKKEGFQYYYPGYVIPGYAKFDYKLRIGACDHYRPKEDIWIPYSKLSIDELPVNVLLQKCQEFSRQLSTASISHEIIYYPLFDKGILNNTPELEGMINPLFVKVHTKNNDFELIVDYQLELEQFELMRYQSFYHPVIEQFNKQSFEDYKTYPSILIRQKRLFKSVGGEEIIDFLLGE